MNGSINDQVSPQETTTLLRLAEKCLGTPGDFVELGCYRGDTSVLLGKLLQKPCGKPQTICGKVVEKTPPNCGKTVENSHKTANNLPQNVEKHLWIYDSFAGLPEKTREDDSGAGANFQAGELCVTKRTVVDKIRRTGLKVAAHPDPATSTVIVKKTWFDQLTSQDLPSEIAFAFLDGDLYESIKTSLKLVAPLLAPQGIMVVHDYNNPELPGSARAVDEWLRQNPEYHLQIKYSLAILRN